MSVAGVVAALGAEARTLGHLSRRGDGLFSAPNGTLVAVSGMGGIAAASAARALIDSGATGLVSWGMAGGLDPALEAGTICLPHMIVSRGLAALPTADHWRDLVRRSIPQGHIVAGGSLLTCAMPIGDVAGKAAAFRDTGAAAVDMESLAVAEVAAARDLPFLAVRAIVDTAADDLPPAVMRASGDGPLCIPRVVLGVVRSPLQLLPLLRLARRYRSATRALAAAARGGALASRA